MSRSDDIPVLIHSEQVAAAWGISQESWKRLVREQQWPHIRPGRRCRSDSRRSSQSGPLETAGDLVSVRVAETPNDDEVSTTHIIDFIRGLLGTTGDS